MVTPSQMLPPNATTFERAIADTAPRQLLDALADAPRRLKSAPPDAVVPWLASEWFLSDFIGYFPDARALLAAGLPWLKVRGTAAAVKQALSWIGMTATLEEDGARLQLDPGNPFAPDNLAAIKHLVGASIPAHVQLYRLHHGYDLRRVGLSSPAALDVGLLSDDSGVWIDGVKLSFGAGHAFACDIAAEHAVGFVREETYSERAYYEDRARLSVWQLDSELVLNHRIIAGQLITLGNEDGLADPEGLASRQTIARASLVLSDDHEPMGNENARFAGYSEIEFAPFELSGSALSDHDNQVKRIPLDQMFHALVVFSPSPLELQGSYPTGREEARGFAARRIQQETGWRGSWDTRRWRADVLGFSITHEGA